MQSISDSTAWLVRYQRCSALKFSSRQAATDAIVHIAVVSCSAILSAPVKSCCACTGLSLPFTLLTAQQIAAARFACIVLHMIDRCRLSEPAGDGAEQTCW